LVEEGKQKISTRDIYVCRCADMSASVQRHNLARLRKELKLTQSDLSKLVSCSPATIKAVEIGKLALSDSLASRISVALGIDKDWLLENDLSAAVPGSYHPPTEDEAVQHAKDAQLALLNELFSRLFAVAAKLEKGSQYRRFTELSIAIELDALKKKAKPLPDAQPSRLAGSNALEYFVQNPRLLDPDLREWVDLKGLLKSNLRLRTDWLPETPSPKRRKGRTPSRKSS
jgi:transcriptional regulator with XRE-family HTH domain